MRETAKEPVMSESVRLAPAMPARAATQPRRTVAVPAPGALLTALVLRLLEWQRRARERHELAALSDEALRDVGLSRADIFEEARKPFWRA
jgi:uncharacterized protein YjiS (DUF1127 family)